MKTTPNPSATKNNSGELEPPPPPPLLDAAEVLAEGGAAADDEVDIVGCYWNRSRTYRGVQSDGADEW